MTGMGLRGGLAGALVGCGVVLAGPVLAAAPSPQGSVHASYHDAEFGSGNSVLAYVNVDPAVVRAVGKIPARWTLALTPAGQATVFLDMTSAPITIGGRTQSVTYTAVFAVLDSSALPSPERSYATSDVEGSPEDVYMIAWNVNGPDYANWLRQGTGLGDIVHDDPGQRFDMPGTALHSFTFASAPRGPAPVRFAATLTDGVVPVYPAITDWWRETPDGTVRIEDAVPGPTSLQFRFVQQWNLTTTPGSVLGRIIGGSQHEFTCSPTAAPAPLLGVVSHQNSPGCLGGERYDSTTFRKRIIRP